MFEVLLLSLIPLALALLDPAIFLPVLAWSIAECVPVNLPFYLLQPLPRDCRVHTPSTQTDASASTHHHACTPPQLAHNCYHLGLLLRGSKFWCLLLLMPHEHPATLPTDSWRALSCLPLPDILWKWDLVSDTSFDLVSARCDRSPTSTSLSSPEELLSTGTEKPYRWCASASWNFAFGNHLKQLYRFWLSYSFKPGLPRSVIDIITQGTNSGARNLSLDLCVYEYG